MDEDRAAHPMTFVSGFILGAMVGAGIALLAAPEAGTRTRRRIRKVAGEFRDTAGDHWDDCLAWADSADGNIESSMRQNQDVMRLCGSEPTGTLANALENYALADGILNY